MVQQNDNSEKDGFRPVREYYRRWLHNGFLLYNEYNYLNDVCSERLSLSNDAVHARQSYLMGQLMICCIQSRLCRPVYPWNQATIGEDRVAAVSGKLSCAYSVEGFQGSILMSFTISYRIFNLNRTLWIPSEMKSIYIYTRWTRSLSDCPELMHVNLMQLCQLGVVQEE
jgi:hypothetical protein